MVEAQNSLIQQQQESSEARVEFADEPIDFEIDPSQDSGKKRAVYGNEPTF